MSPAPVAVSCGEPAGIGPELAEAAWHALGPALPFFWIGDPRHLPGSVPHRVIAGPAEAASAARDGLPVLWLDFDGPRIPGQPQPAHAARVVDAIARGVTLVQDGAASALCTLPIHKQALAEGAGFAFPGHTEYLAHLAGGVEVAMMLASDQLRVVPATIHIPLAEVPAALTPDLLETRIRITHAGLRDLFGLARPRIAVAGLNPHAGEGGRMGHEEERVIAPVLARLRAEGLDLAGPLSADTMFHAAARARYDAAVAMYHDQALIPIKTLDFDRGVNLTLGLPFIRTSPDHGTAFDIAGHGAANPASTLAALRLAWRLAGGADPETKETHGD
ncbi:4-hydroxythreonine-4-phosphate dehydrogenase PdxA [Roseivivax sp. CAU 1761]